MESFISCAMQVFIGLNKTVEAFTFLASVESRIYNNSAAYSQGITDLLDHIVTLPKPDIERNFLTASFTPRQN